MLGKRSLARAVQSTRATPYLVFLPVVRLDEVPLVTLFLPGAAFLPGATFLAATAFLAPPSPRAGCNRPPCRFRRARGGRSSGRGWDPASPGHHAEHAWPGDDGCLTARVPPHVDHDAAYAGHNTRARHALGCDCDSIANMCHLYLLKGRMTHHQRFAEVTLALPTQLGSSGPLDPGAPTSPLVPRGAWLPREGLFVRVPSGHPPGRFAPVSRSEPQVPQMTVRLPCPWTARAASRRCRTRRV